MLWFPAEGPPARVLVAKGRVHYTFKVMVDRATVRHFALEAAVASLRLVLAVHLVLLAMAAPVASMGIEKALFLVALMSPPALLLAAPMAPFHRWICSKSAPFVGRGTWWVAGYGVILVAIAVLAGAGGAVALLLAVGFPLAAAAVIAAYVWLWRLGDAWLGEASAPKVGRRWAFAMALIVLTSAWIPYVVYAHISDTCYDRGGAMRSGWTCEY